MTAREALLEIRRRLATSPVPALAEVAEVDDLVATGLDREGLENFELSDQLADRLAAALDFCRKIQGGHYEPESLSAELASVLALPPDLEAMVERRIGR